MAFKTKIVKRKTPNNPWTDYEYKFVVARDGKVIAVGTYADASEARREAKSFIAKYKKRYPRTKKSKRTSVLQTKRRSANLRRMLNN